MPMPKLKKKFIKPKLPSKEKRLKIASKLVEKEIDLYLNQGINVEAITKHFFKSLNIIHPNINWLNEYTQFINESSIFGNNLLNNKPTDPEPIINHLNQLIQKTNPEIAVKFIENFPDKLSQWFLLISLFYAGEIKTLDLLLKNNLNVNLQYPKDQEPEWMQEMTALIYTSANNHPEIVELLLKKGANQYLLNNKGETVYDLANSKIKKLILSKHKQNLKKIKQNPNIFKQMSDLEKFEFLRLIIELDDSNSLDFLLQNDLDPNIQNKDGWTALMYASRYNRLQIVKLLLEYKADPNIQNKDGWTALIYASVYAHLKITELLLEYRTDPNIQNKKGFTALMLAVHNKNFKITELLLKKGANQYLLNEDGRIAYDLAKSDKIRALLNKYKN